MISSSRPSLLPQSPHSASQSNPIVNAAQAIPSKHLVKSQSLPNLNSLYSSTNNNSNIFDLIKNLQKNNPSKADQIVDALSNNVVKYSQEAGGSLELEVVKDYITSCLNEDKGGLSTSVNSQASDSRESSVSDPDEASESGVDDKQGSADDNSLSVNGENGHSSEPENSDEIDRFLPKALKKVDFDLKVKEQTDQSAPAQANIAGSIQGLAESPDFDGVINKISEGFDDKGGKVELISDFKTNILRKFRELDLLSRKDSNQKGEFSEKLKALVNDIEGFNLPSSMSGMENYKENFNNLYNKLSVLKADEQGKQKIFENEREAAYKNNDQEKFQQAEKSLNESKGSIKKLDAAIESVKKNQATCESAIANVEVISNLSISLACLDDKNPISLPLSIPLLGNGAESGEVEKGNGLYNALNYTEIHKRNNAIPRIFAIRNNVAEFASNLNEYRRKQVNTSPYNRADRRTSLVDLKHVIAGDTSSLKAANDVFNCLGTEEGKREVHKLAASNLIAAGFNARTNAFNSPSLRYKMESPGGLSSMKKFSIGRVGTYARDLEEHLKPRLDLLDQTSKILRNELFRDGKPVDISHAVVTPKYAMEAASLIIASIPNELLVVKGAVEVKDFLAHVQVFENKLDSEKNPGSVSADDLTSFKKIVNDFHKEVALWLTADYEKESTNIITMANDISKDIASARLGFVSASKKSIGNFINLAGGQAVRGTWSSVQKYLTKTYQKERMRQLISTPESIGAMASLKANLNKIKDHATSTDNTKKNVDALLDYLSGRSKSLTVKLEGKLQDDLIKQINEFGKFLDRTWDDYQSKRSSKNNANQTRPEVLILSANQNKEVWSFSQKRNLPSSTHSGSSSLFGSRNSGNSGSTNSPKPVSDFNFSILGRMSEWLDATNRVPLSLPEELDKVLSAEALKNRGLVNVYGRDNNCWVRAPWVAAAAHYLDASEFSKKVLEVQESVINELSELVKDTKKIEDPIDFSDIIKFSLLLGKLDRDRITQGDLDSFHKAANKFQREVGSNQTSAKGVFKFHDDVEQKMRRLLIALSINKVGFQADQIRALLGSESMIQADYQYGTYLLNAIGLPVVIHNVNGVPNTNFPKYVVRLPDNEWDEQKSEKTPVDSWPVIHYEGKGTGGHFQCYKPLTASTS